MFNFLKITFFVVTLGSLLILPNISPVSAQGLAQLAECSGPDCGTCEVIKLANGLIMWLIGFVFLLFAVLLVRAGVLLVTSGGNPGALQSAKDNFINALIGLIIILAAWLIVDTIMRALVGPQGNEGQIKLVTGNRTGYLLWSQIECTAQVSPSKAVFDYIDLVDIDHGSPPADTGYDGPQGEGEVLALRQGGSVTVVPYNTADMQTIPFMGHRVTMHKNVIPSLQRINARWQQMGGHGFYRVISVGGYRQSPGWHGYGLALDINPDQNPHCKPNNPDPRWPQCGGQNILITDMPPAFRQLFLSEGWGWGGNWNSSKDAMHFSQGENEQGHMVGDAI